MEFELDHLEGVDGAGTEPSPETGARGALAPRAGTKGSGGRGPFSTHAEMDRRVVLKVAWALGSRAVLARRKADRVEWGLAIARHRATTGWQRGPPHRRFQPAELTGE